MSPSAMAPSSASVSACSPTSASEWPSSAWEWGTLTPHSQTWSPGAKRCTSKPCPVRTSGRRGRVTGHGQVLRCRQLAIGFAAFHQRHRQTGPFGNGGVVGEVRLAGSRRGLVRGQDFREAEALRRLCAPEAGPRRRFRRCGSWGPARFRVSATGRAAMAAGVSARASSTRSTISALTNGRTASWMTTRAGAERRQGAQSVEDGVLARIPACDGRG